MTGAHGRPALPEPISAGRIIAIIRGLDAEATESIGRTLIEAGVRAVEVPLRHAGSLDGIGALAAIGRAIPGVAIGAGTILDRAAAADAVAAGATYLVMPHTDPDLVRWAVDHGIPALPGAGSVTEVLTGWRAGAAAIKVFPASVLGIAFIREIRGPLPDVPLIPTGGIDDRSAGAFIDAGAAAIGVGGWLTAARSTSEVRDRARLIQLTVANRSGGER